MFCFALIKPIRNQSKLIDILDFSSLLPLSYIIKFQPKSRIGYIILEFIFINWTWLVSPQPVLVSTFNMNFILLYLAAFIQFIKHLFIRFYNWITFSKWFFILVKTFHFKWSIYKIIILMSLNIFDIIIISLIWYFYYLSIVFISRFCFLFALW